MSKNRQIERAKELIEIIQKADKAYFTDNKSILTDEQYDEYWYELNDLLKQSDVQKALKKTSMPLGEQNSYLDKVDHLVFVGSLDKFKLDDKSFQKKMNKWLQTYDTGKGWVVESKLDGLTLVQYTKAQLTFATRGGSQRGENVTAQLQQIPSIWEPALKADNGLVIRGEAIISKEHFQQIVKAQRDKLVKVYKQIDFGSLTLDEVECLQNAYESQPFDAQQLKALAKAHSSIKAFADQLNSIYSNGRNLASAAVRTLDTSSAKTNHIEWIVYDVMNREELTELESIRLLQSFGYQTVDYLYFETKEKLMEWLTDTQAIQSFRNQSKYEIDGLVVKPNAKIQNPEITGHHVKGQIALKFAPQTAVTKLIDVTWTVGQSNRMTPVAIFEPVVLGGATLQKASLGSYAKLKELDLHENDTIVVARANDVIPQVVSVQADERQPNAKAYDLPNDTYLDGGIVRSKTIDIPLAEKISRFASEVKIESAKTQTFQKLIDAGLMKSLKDLYLLKYEELIKLKGFGEQSVTTLLDEIEHSKQASFQQILKGLNYSGLGSLSTICNNLARHHNIFKCG
jgi:DNA ligase (NAD+)